MNAPESVAAGFEFLRPLWLLGLLGLPLLLLIWRRRGADGGVWQQHVDAHLLAHLVEADPQRRAPLGTALWLAVAALVIVALAGPSWRQLSVPLWQQEAPLVIALDLSAAMRATDLPPSRLTQARAKLNALLTERQGGQVGLLVYAGEPFTVAPITRDARTVTALLDSLTPDLMPVEGQRADLAIGLALDMLKANGASRGDILLVTDRTDASAPAAAAQARSAGMRVSVLGVGTLAGAPLTGAQGFITGPDGQPQLARLDPTALGATALAGGGTSVTVSVDNSDLRTLDLLDPRGRASADAATGASGPMAGNQRSDDGYWLLLLALPLALLGFRRGWLAMLPLALTLGLLPAAPPALAADPPEGAAVAPAATTTAPTPDSWWDGLWQRADQRAYQALNRGDAASARALAKDPAIAAAAAFRGDDYAAAAETWSGQDDADAHYNRGNALAKAGKLPEALAAYDEALKRSPAMDDAIANRKLVADLLQQQQQQQQQQDGQQQDGQKQEGQQQDEKQQDGQQQQGQQQDGEQQDGQQQDGKQQDGQQQDGEQSDGKQQDGEQSPADSAESKSADSEEQASDSKKPDSANSSADEDKDSAQPDAQPQSAQAQAEQQAAEEAARQQMQQALDQADKSGDAKPGEPVRTLTPEERVEAERSQALQQWLRRIPDDPGGLLRRKFELEHRRRQAEQQQDGAPQ